MQREIKFRIWDVKAKFMKDDGTTPGGRPHMKYNIGLSVYEKGWFSGIEGIHVPFNDPNLPIMQYTGLKDKNGKEIYEGDILSASRTVTGLPLPNGKVAEIFGNIPQEERTWNEILVAEIKVNANSISFVLPEEGGTYQERGKKLEWEIIGNIYQNSDLIPNP